MTTLNISEMALEWKITLSASIESLSGQRMQDFTVSSLEIYLLTHQLKFFCKWLFYFLLKTVIIRRGGEPVGTPTGSPLFVSRNKKGRTSRNCLFLISSEDDFRFFFQAGKYSKIALFTTQIDKNIFKALFLTKNFNIETLITAKSKNGSKKMTFMQKFVYFRVLTGLKKKT